LFKSLNNNESKTGRLQENIQGQVGKLWTISKIIATTIRVDIVP